VSKSKGRLSLLKIEGIKKENMEKVQEVSDTSSEEALEETINKERSRFKKINCAFSSSDDDDDETTPC